MQALRYVDIRCRTFVVDDSMLTLCRMQHLKCIELIEAVPKDFDSLQIFAKLVYLLARDRPEVIVAMNGKVLDDSHW